MIRIEKLNKTYDAHRRHANHVLHDVSFTLPDAGFVCIVGASGCGKTSLLNAIGGLDRFDNGTIATDSVSVSRFGSRDLERERNNNFGYIFQNYYLLTDHSVAYNVYLGLHALDLTHKEKLQRVREALSAVNMERFARRSVSDLSGGQQQRVAIARALARRPRVIFADEPTGNLDSKNTVTICKLLRRISKTSLVVMVTHEDHIAHFFADRIITIHAGRIQDDITSWERESMAAQDNNLYAGDYEEEIRESEQVKLRVLYEKGAKPAELTVAVLHDRIVLKPEGGRTVSCSTPGEEPFLLEGKRPELVLDEADETAEASDIPAARSARAGKGLTPRMMLEEAIRLLKGKGQRFLTTWIFLAALSVLATFIVSDYITVSSIDPREFILTDSHILELEFNRGPELSLSNSSTRPQVRMYLDYLAASGLEHEVLPIIPVPLEYSTDVYLQMGEVKENLGSYSYVPITRLDESDLIYGRMPEKSTEVVVDRWVLDVFLAKDGIVQSSLPDITDMLGVELQFYKSQYAPTIVGICDCGDPTLYVPREGLISVGSGSVSSVISLSELKAMDPEQYGDLTLEKGECIVIINNAGSRYKTMIGDKYTFAYNCDYVIKYAFEADTWARAVVSDESLDEILNYVGAATQNFVLYCADKEAMLDYINRGMPKNLKGQILLTVKDAHGVSMEKYLSASSMKADARTIVTVTIILMCMVMLYLLQRSGVQQRIGMMAVYRLLGIPRRKLLMIFALESVLFSLVAVLPATALTWAVIQILTILPSVEFSMLLPLNAAAVVCAAISVYYLLVSLLPTLRLLRLPPARLAGKYDL